MMRAEIAAVHCLLTVLLWKIGVSDEKTYTIPNRYCLELLFLGVLKMILLKSPLSDAALGAAAAGVPLLFLYIFSGGRAIGGGDVKMMFAAGVCLGAKGGLPALFIGALSALLFHPLRMKFCGAPSRLAFGPYLSFGVWITYFFFY